MQSHSEPASTRSSFAFKNFWVWAIWYNLHNVVRIKSMRTACEEIDAEVFMFWIEDIL